MSYFNYNRATFGGRITADPVLKYTASGVPVTTFCIAVNRRIYKEGAKPETDFITCVAWRNTAEFITKYFRKGSPICVDGSVQNRTWETDSGEKRYINELIVGEAHFVDSKPKYHTNEPPTLADEAIPSDDDLPF
jgi:single-strand DNA-binding protein